MTVPTIGKVCIPLQKLQNCNCRMQIASVVLKINQTKESGSNDDVEQLDIPEIIICSEYTSYLMFQYHNFKSHLY